ncbi:divisome protein SepX/GlpR [Phytoactinopolyspora limicola]|uniref:divisome protein SepX/GlpR n=1 Tax=Phytoactinopolyspora limicola TaxID=2715536 RepID=UPI0014072AE7|nr:hypothetical protein [Phytoactinopolyspora limicola]
MGYSGLIYAAIVAAWLAVLVPRWVRRNEEVERARETDAASGVRVLTRRTGPVHAPHRVATDGADSRIIVSGDRSGLAAPAAGGDAAHPAPTKTAPVGAAARAGRRGPDHQPGSELRRLDETFAVAARRRRRMLGTLTVATVVAIVLVYVGPAPAWVPAVIGSGLVGFVMLARIAAIEQRRRRAALIRHARRRVTTHVVEQPAPEPARTDDGKRVAVLDAPEVPEQPREGTWDPVDVPLPMYVNKPKAPRVARTIDLSTPGSWTSGRLETSASVELPARPPAVAAENTRDTSNDDDATDLPEETRRAVGE